MSVTPQPGPTTGTSAVPDPPGLPGLLGITAVRAAPDRASGELTVRADHLAPTGYLHAATLVALADTVCGYGTLAGLPDGKVGFTTVELSSHHLATAGVGTRLCVVATPVHRGRTTQVWDAAVTAPDGPRPDRPLIAFRCTQLLLDAPTPTRDTTRDSTRDEDTR